VLLETPKEVFTDTSTEHKNDASLFRPLTVEELQRRREDVRRKHKAQNAAASCKDEPVEPEKASSAEKDESCAEDPSETEQPAAETECFIAFARVFSGTLRAGQAVYVVGPKYDPVTLLDAEVITSECLNLPLFWELVSLFTVRFFFLLLI